jgi:D-threonate/D-erythronate kinase
VTSRRVGLVADDVTGATDAAVQFAALGWTAHLLRSRTAGPDLAGPGPFLLAVATDVRAVGNDDAAERSAAAVRQLLSYGCDRLYVKIDSTMRGSVAGQLCGALAAWSVPHPDAVAVLCPAFPGRNGGRPGRSRSRCDAPGANTRPPTKASRPQFLVTITALRL